MHEGAYLNCWTDAGSATVTQVEDCTEATAYSGVTVGSTLHHFAGTTKEA